MTRSAEHSTP